MSAAGLPPIAPPLSPPRFTITPMLVIALLGSPLPLGLMAWFFVVAPEFAAMFAEFGGPLPLPTAVVLSPAWAPAMALVYLLALALPLLLLRERTVRDFAMIAAVVLGLLAVMASAALLYLPIFTISAALRP